MTDFKDHFSTKARAYAEFRPDYPAEVFDRVSVLPAQRRVAWDVGTGAGQAAVALAERFSRVIATDASAEQIAHARPHDRVHYQVARAEASGLAPGSIDLVTVAQAMHWFDLPAFYAEVRRVLAPGGVLAAWSYCDGVLDDPALDAVLQRFNNDTVGAFWPPEREHVRQRYRDLPFPFDEIALPVLAIERDWTLGELTGYVRTWSACTRYAAHHGVDPVPALVAGLTPGWGDPTASHRIRWPLSFLAGR